jgi:hypothetical protein
MDGNATKEALFHFPKSIAYAKPKGINNTFLYVADSGNKRVRKINIQTNEVTTLKEVEVKEDDVRNLCNYL